MVRLFIAKGSAVTVWNRTASKARALAADGATIAATPEDAVSGADRVHIVLPDDAIVDGVLDRLVPALQHAAFLVAIEPARIFVQIAVVTDLVTGAQNGVDRIRVGFDGMPGDEKRCG